MWCKKLGEPSFYLIYWHTQGRYLFFMFYIELSLYFFTNKLIESFILKTTAGLNFFPSLSVALTVSNRRILLYTPHKIRLGTQISKVFIPYGVTSWRICRAWPGYRTATNLWRFYINNRVQVPPSASSQTSIPRTALKELFYFKLHLPYRDFLIWETNVTVPAYLHNKRLIWYFSSFGYL